MTSGPVLFAQYAYPPNALGYCGPPDAAGMIDAAAGGDDRFLAGTARQFEGAWPYLELIAAANGIHDPLAREVVEAYWIGSQLLDTVTPALLGRSLDERFRRPAGAAWDHMAEFIGMGCGPHHSLHVFGIYPWVGLLRAGRVGEPLRVLDRCRVRWGRVRSIDGNVAVIRSCPLVWDGHHLTYGLPQDETVAVPTFVCEQLRPGQWVSAHWDWVCDRLSPLQLARLSRYTDRSLRAVESVSHPGPAAVLS